MGSTAHLSDSNRNAEQLLSRYRRPLWKYMFWVIYVNAGAVERRADRWAKPDG